MKTIVITGEDREVDKILRENRRRASVGLIKVKESKGNSKEVSVSDTKAVEVPAKARVTAKKKAE